MDTIFNMGDNNDDFEERINMDDLYERKQNRDLNKVSIYRKILSQVHKKIKLTSRQNVDVQCCWYVFPEIILGVPGYNQANCVTYVMHELKENGFALQYTNPNLLFVSWKHWVPSYVRSEIQKRTGYKVDGMGKIIEKPFMKSESNPQEHLQKQQREISLFSGNRQNDSTNYTSNNSSNVSSSQQYNGSSKTSKFFKPSVKSIYNMSFFNELNKKL